MGKGRFRGIKKVEIVIQKVTGIRERKTTQIVQIDDGKTQKGSTEIERREGKCWERE